jgi:hypothetical protein
LPAATGRTDISGDLLQYFAPVFSGSPGIISELLRVNLDIPPPRRRINSARRFSKASIPLVRAYHNSILPIFPIPRVGPMAGVPMTT